jgi:FeS assembly SUF system regulator
MLQIARLTDYGIILMTRLAAASSERLVPCRDLAAQTGLPLPTVRKLLKVLTHQQLLESVRGVHGGYRLARPAGTISIAGIIAALEGPLALTQCGEGPGCCELEAGCPVTGHWHIINNAVRTTLEGVTLAELVRPATTDLLIIHDGAAGIHAGATARHEPRT